MYFIVFKENVVYLLFNFALEFNVFRLSNFQIKQKNDKLQEIIRSVHQYAKQQIYKTSFMRYLLSHLLFPRCTKYHNFMNMIKIHH